MALITTATAKLHLRVDASDEDELILIWIGVAEQQAARFLNRSVYVDQAALDAAIAAAPATLAAATTAYDAAIAAADAMEDGVDKDAATKYAKEAYANALTASDMAQRGVVLDDSIRAALLLMVGGLYENRGDARELAQPARDLLTPYRVGMGV